MSKSGKNKQNHKETLSFGEVAKRLLHYFRKHGAIIIAAFLIALIGNTLGLFIPLLIGRGIDTMIGVGDVNFSRLWQIVVWMGVLSVVSTVMYWAQSVLINKASNRIIHNIRQDTFNQLSNLPLGYFDTHSHGDILSRLSNDIDALGDGLMQGTSQVFSNVVGVVGSFIFMMGISKGLTALVVIITPLCFVIAYFVANSSAKYFAAQSKTLGELNGHVEEIIGNHEVVSAFGYEETAKAAFLQMNQRLKEHGQNSQFYSSLVNPSTRLINNIAYVCVCLFGGLGAIRGSMTVGMISSFLTYSTQFARPINEMTGVATQLQGAFASARRIFEVLDEKEEIETGQKLMNNENCKGDIVFKNVDFSYDKNRDLIKNLNLHVRPATRIAIVGPTGAGKTTLVNLLMRFYDVDAGEIRIDGQDIKGFTCDSLRKSMAMVLQETWLFSGTIRENIAYGAIDATEEEVIAAAKKAYAHGFIKRLSNGYDTMINEEGSNFSQGQKQLITIARAMCAKAPILLLDEATSSVDTKTEKRIQRAFLKMMEGKTSFVIAHRLSTIRDADLILVLNEGQIIEQGSHEQLLAKKGFYANLYQSQFENAVEAG